ncbi:hypothetical protein BRDID11002_83400 [Bradyrhizobium diazoefficiens]
MIISIVGGGATGITILRHLAELVASGRDNGAISGIQLFDKSGFDGGVAYRTQSDRHLLNMKASTMSIRPGDADEFLRWLRARGLSCHGNRHLPRMVYRTTSTPCDWPRSRNAAAPACPFMSSMPKLSACGSRRIAMSC